MLFADEFNFLSFFFVFFWSPEVGFFSLKLKLVCVSVNMKRLLQLPKNK